MSEPENAAATLDYVLAVLRPIIRRAMTEGPVGVIVRTSKSELEVLVDGYGVHVNTRRR